jgi:hypothetical protein
MQAVSQPLHGRACNEDRPFKRIAALAAKLISDGGKQTMARANRLSGFRMIGPWPERDLCRFFFYITKILAMFIK